MVDESLYSEEVGILHSHTHIVDTVLFKVAESPVGLFCCDLVESRLLDLNHEVLAVLNLGGWDIVEASGLYVEFSAGFTHPYECRSGRNCRQEDSLTCGVVPFPVDRIDGRHVGLWVLAADTEYEIRVSSESASYLLPFSSYTPLTPTTLIVSSRVKRLGSSTGRVTLAPVVCFGTACDVGQEIGRVPTL